VLDHTTVFHVADGTRAGRGVIKAAEDRRGQFIEQTKCGGPWSAGNDATRTPDATGLATGTLNPGAKSVLSIR
jgi:hypothetical protein